MSFVSSTVSDPSPGYRVIPFGFPAVHPENTQSDDKVITGSTAKTISTQGSSEFHKSTFIEYTKLSDTSFLQSSVRIEIGKSDAITESFNW